MLFQNPEFKKNLLLEVNPTRLIVCFGLILLISASLYFPHLDAPVDPRLDYKHVEEFFNFFCGIGFFFSIIWGTYLTANSISEEMRQKTWDFVRMSSLSPAKILAGKLFGATSLVWIVSLIAIMPVMLYQGLQLIPDPAPFRSQYVTVFVFIACLFLWVILSHAISLISSLYATFMEKERGSNIFVTLGITIANLFVGGGLLVSFGRFHDSPPFNASRTPWVTDWYGYDFYTLDIILFSLVVATFWAVAGAHRTLRQSLQFRDLPTAWVLFLLTVSLFLNGFAPEQQFKVFLIWPILLSSISMGLMALTECRNIVRYKTCWARFESGEYLEALKYLPLWVISFIALLTSLVLGILLVDHKEETIASVISIVCVMIRDLLVLHWIAWKPGVRRPLIGYFIYATVIYFLIPILFRGETIFHPLLPNSLGKVDTSNAMSYWGIQFACLATAGWLFARRWKSAFKTGDAVKQPAP